MQACDVHTQVAHLCGSRLQVSFRILLPLQRAVLPAVCAVYRLPECTVPHSEIPPLVPRTKGVKSHSTVPEIATQDGAIALPTHAAGPVEPVGLDARSALDGIARPPRQYSRLGVPQRTHLQYIDAAVRTAQASTRGIGLGFRV